MKKITVLILIILSLKVAGQNNNVGIVGGINLTNVTVKPIAYPLPTGNRIGFTGGLTYEHLFKNNFSIGADVIYIQRGFTNKIFLTDASGNVLGDATIKFGYDYISIPIKAGFTFGKKVFGFVKAGVLPSYLVSAKTIAPTFDASGKVNGTENVDETKIVTKFDIAGIAEIGGGIKVKEKAWLFLSFAGQYSFTTITNKQYFGTGTIIKHYGMSLSIGLKYNITKAKPIKQGE